MIRSVLIAASVLLVAAPAMAGTAVTGISTNCRFGAYSSDEALGWGFATSAALRVTALGWRVIVPNAGGSPRLTSSHQLGLWTDSGTLLGSATVTPGTATAGEYRYASVTPFLLMPGNYRIAGHETAADGDRYSTCVNSISTAPEITLTNWVRSPDDGGFAFPSIVDPSLDDASHGPNFQFIAGVPEPASWAMLIAGFGLIGAAARRRRLAVAA